MDTLECHSPFCNVLKGRLVTALISRANHKFEMFFITSSTEAFDTKYKSAWDKLPAEYKDQMQYDDGAPPTAVRLCNLAFGELSLRTSVQGRSKPLIDP